MGAAAGRDSPGGEWSGSSRSAERGARKALAAATVWIGYGPYLDLLEPLRRPDQLRRDGRLTEERGRCEQALDLATQGLKVALISSGDSGIYGMAGLALELWLAELTGIGPPSPCTPACQPCSWPPPGSALL